MSTATPPPAKAKAPKQSPQADVRIVGGKTTVRLRSYGNATIARMMALCSELRTNAATAPSVSARSEEVRDAIVSLSAALGFHGLPKTEVTEQGDEVE